MRMAVNCPYCKRSLATSAAFAGQTIACPNCRGEFVFQPPASTPPPAASNSDLLPPGASRLKLSATADHALPPTSSATAVVAPPQPTTRPGANFTSPPVPLTHPTASQPSDIPQSALRAPHSASSPVPASTPSAPTSLAPPPAPSNVARFKTASTTTTTIAPAADGKLPGLLLADAQGTVAGESGEKAIPLWLACVAVVGSTLVSLLLLFADASGAPSARSRHADARTEIAQFYGNDSAPLRPYQVLLREAQLARSRGDRNLERQRYRQVLSLLRSEKRSKYETITGTPSDDEQLAQTLSALLSND
jgi:hypothetical protein